MSIAPNSSVKTSITTKKTTGTREITYTYDNKGNLATLTNERGQTTSYSYDVMDRLTQVTYPNNTREHFTYDSNGNLLTRTVPTPADHTFTYNGADLRVSNTSPLNLATTYTYDKSKNLTAIHKPSGKTIVNNYSNGRLNSTVTDEGTTNYAYLFANKVGSISKGSESFSFTYDGTLLTSTSQSGVLNHTTNFTYNNDFQVSSSTYAGVTETYTYDNDGLLLTSGEYTLTRDTQNAYVTSLTDGTLTQTRTYNNFGEVTEVSDNTFTYELSQRDNSGAITQKVETLNGITNTYDYTFDEMGRLTQVQKDSSVVEEYTYDNNGNRASATVHGTSITASYTLDDNLVVYGDNTYSYDDDGYLTDKTTPHGTTKYSYGTLGELKEVITPTKTITYLQNVNNQRVAKLVDGVITEKYLWANLTTLLAVYDANDNLVQRFGYADNRMPVSMTDSNGTKYYLHYDQVGTLRAVSDAQMNIVKEITYDTFGNILNDTNPSFKVPFGFAGGLYDSDTKLTRFGYRDYDAYTGKWTAKDPIGFSGGDSNLYGYVLGDPVGGFDASGLTSTYPATNQNRCSCGNIQDLLQNLGNLENSRDWSFYKSKGRFDENTNKCNLFVEENLQNNDTYVPNMNGLGYNGPTAGQWGNPNIKIPGFPIVNNPQPGDIIAIPHNYSDATGHVGIVFGNNLSISHSSKTNSIQINDWGFRNGQNPIFRRCRCQ